MAPNNAITGAAFRRITRVKYRLEDRLNNNDEDKNI